MPLIRESLFYQQSRQAPIVKRDSASLCDFLFPAARPESGVFSPDTKSKAEKKIKYKISNSHREARAIAVAPVGRTVPAQVGLPEAAVPERVRHEARGREECPELVREAALALIVVCD